MHNQKNENTHFDGVVRWFNDKKGYGFIDCLELDTEVKNKAIYVHYSHVMTNEKFKTLSKGQHVTFEISNTDKGLMAVNVREQKIQKVHATVVSNQ